MYPLTLLCIAAARRGISSVGLRLTAPSAEGAKGAASADAGFRLCGGDQRTEPVWRLCNRPLETFAPCGGNRWQVAAALSAAVTTTKPIEDAPPFRRNQLRKKVATQTPAALRERGSGGEALLSEKRPLPQRLPLPRSPLPLLHLLFKLGEFLGCIALKGARAGHHHEPCADHETHGAAEEKLVHAITSLRERVRG